MVYIAPPYNTRNDFIYNDDFSVDTDTFLKQSNQKDDVGNRLVVNTEANGRYHSDWLTMMFPRIRLARNILRNDGVLLASIDDNEYANLKKLCDAVFGADNYLGTIIWKNATDNNPTNIATEHESIIVYARSKKDIEGVWKSKFSAVRDALVAVGKELIGQFSDPDELQAAYTKWFRENRAYLGTLDRYKYIDEGGVYIGSQSVHNPGREGYRYDVLHDKTGLPCKEPLMGYRFPPETMNRLLKEDRILFGKDHNKVIELKVYAEDYSDKFSSVFELDGRLGAYDLKTLFPEVKKIFTNPKPVDLLRHCLSFVVDSKDIVVDFFAGSATTAHALMSLNAEDGGQRRFVMVQLPEPCDPESEAAKASFENIAEIGKERIRRAGMKLKEEHATTATALDIGFRVLKVDTSNMKDVYYAPDAVRQLDLPGQIDNIKEGRTSEDLLFQVLLDWGVDLSLPIAEEKIEGKTVYFVDENALAACFDPDINETLVKKLAARKPLRVVFRDSGYSNDSVKINVEQIFKLISPSTDVKSI